MKIILALATAFYLTALSSGCSHAPASLQAEKLADVKDIPTIAEDYKVQPGDQIDVKFFYNSELNELVTVRPDGRISVQLADDVPAAGLTPAKLAGAIAQAYSSELNDPEVSVIVRTFAAQKVYVDGEVNRPGEVPLTVPLTVLQAIGQAGGMKDTAERARVIIIRRGEGGKKVPMEVDLEAAVAGAGDAHDIALMPQDVVYVPASRIADVNKWIDMYIRKNIPINTNLGYAPL